MADPVAEFLARERVELGDLTDEFRVDNPASDIGSMDDLRDHPDITSIPFTDAPNASRYAAASSPLVSGSLLNGVSDNGGDEQRPCSVASSHPSTTDNQQTVSAMMESWRENFDAEIKKRDEKEDQKRRELEEGAKKELETWYAHYRQQLSARSAEHRSEAPKDASGKVYGGYSGPKPSANDVHVWESVCSMCDLQGKNVKSSNDLSRMRGLLLNLKAN